MPPASPSAPDAMNLMDLMHRMDYATAFAAVVLLLFSVMSVATIIERAIRYRNADIDADEFMARIRELLHVGKYKEAATLSEQTPGPVAAVVRTGLKNTACAKDELRDAIDRTRMRQAAMLDKNLPVLGTVGSTAPFVGLFGTVFGIIKSFHDIQNSQSTALSVVGLGIAEALYATAAGLIVAVIAVVAYNFFVNWSSHFAVEMDTAGNEIIHLINPSANGDLISSSQG